MAGNDREPIGRKGKPTRPVKQKVSRRRYEDDDYDDYDDYEDEEPMPRKGKGKGKGRKPRGKRGWLWLLLKLAIVFAVLIAIYGVYLDQKIRSRIDGKVWQLPAAVYGRMVNLEPDMTISKNEMVKLLEATQYRQVSKMTRPGEFTVQANSIEMIRRPFDFPDSKEGQVRARLTFDGDHLATIVNMENNRQFGFFRLDPRLITMISSPNGEQRLFVPRKMCIRDRRDGTAVISQPFVFREFQPAFCSRCTDRLSGALPDGEYQFQHRRTRSSRNLRLPLFSASSRSF